MKNKIKDSLQNKIQVKVLDNIQDEIADKVNNEESRKINSTKRKSIHPYGLTHFLWLVTIISTLFLVGCKGKETLSNQDVISENLITFTDSLGREVTVSNPQKVAAFMGSYAEVWLLSGGTLAAVTDDAYDERNLELSDEVITLGKMNAVNMELVIEEGIDFVLLSSETAEHIEVKDTLDKLGIPSAYFKVETFQDYLAMLDICTDITGRKDLYKTNGEDIGVGIDEIIQAVPEGISPSVLFLRAFSTGVKAKGSDSMTGIMLKELGCMNIADTDNSLLEDLNMEKIVEEDPDFIFVITMGSSSEKALEAVNELLLSNPAWEGLAAVKNGHYHVLPKQLFHSKPNVRWKESYEMLAEILYESK